jgi:hypothetical protein
MAPPQTSTGTYLVQALEKMQDKAGLSNFPEFCQTLVFMGTPISQPISMPTLDTLAGRPGLPVPPCCYFLEGKKLVEKRALTKDEELLVFNIHNIFCYHWFLSVDHFRANAILAQKAENRNFFWVEFAPQFHTLL